MYLHVCKRNRQMSVLNVGGMDEETGRMASDWNQEEFRSCDRLSGFNPDAINKERCSCSVLVHCLFSSRSLPVQFCSTSRASMLPVRAARAVEALRVYARCARLMPCTCNPLFIGYAGAFVRLWQVCSVSLSYRYPYSDLGSIKVRACWYLFVHVQHKII